MADEQQNENVEENVPAATDEAEAPEAAAEAVEAEAPEVAEAAEAAAEGDEQAAPASAPASPKEQRRQKRAAKVAAAAGSRAQRSPEERQAERDAVRKAKAARRRLARARTRERAKAARASGGEPTAPREHGEGRQKLRQGVVVSDKADKTITVRIDTARQHRRYHKIVRSSSTLHAHDERNDAHVGDTVIVRESRPLSRLKRWRLVEVVERAR
jgi:small subunit ribosomal protein S17